MYACAVDDFGHLCLQDSFNNSYIFLALFTNSSLKLKTGTFGCIWLYKFVYNLQIFPIQPGS